MAWTGQKCPHCNGTGRVLGADRKPCNCPKCAGTGDQYKKAQPHTREHKNQHSGKLTLVKRERKEETARGGPCRFWTEWQLKDGRTVVFRSETPEKCIEWAKEKGREVGTSYAGVYQP